MADDWAELCAQAQENLDWILLHDAAPVAEEILRQQIQEKIYDAYTPMYYQRRHMLGRSVTSYLLEPGALFVTSTAEANHSLLPGYAFENRYAGAFLELLEVGDMGFWRRHFPRPAVTGAQGVMEHDPKLRRAVEAGVKREFGNA
jgi:hypothetical protein